ncbi:MAG: GlsB/YeaQ/YmgE family stress response membrane protein [Burkholderiales bacterium]|nr:GlsB/YeaQ/YmgE family stress response membrane protein [Burkholderiales bacterium]
MGAGVGFLAGLMMKSDGRTLLVENILVGVFGAFMGGDFIVSLINGGVVNDKDFKASSLAMAVVGAVTTVAILRLMRHVVGPMRAGKAKAPRN